MLQNPYDQHICIRHCANELTAGILLSTFRMKCVISLPAMQCTRENVQLVTWQRASRSRTRARLSNSALRCLDAA